MVNMSERDKILLLQNTLQQDEWFRWISNQHHKGIKPAIRLTGPTGNRYYARNYGRIYVRSYDDWPVRGACLMVHELERRDPKNHGAFIRPRKVQRLVWPSKMYTANKYKEMAHKLARITDNNMDQADVDITAARMLLRMKELHDKDKLFVSTQEERRKNPRARTDFARAGEGYTKWPKTTEPTMTTKIPFKIS